KRLGVEPREIAKGGLTAELAGEMGRELGQIARIGLAGELRRPTLRHQMLEPAPDRRGEAVLKRGVVPGRVSGCLLHPPIFLRDCRREHPTASINEVLTPAPCP